MEVIPWELNGDLTKDRIIDIAFLIAEKRGDVIDLHDEILGDTPRSLGTRCYECCRTMINEVADSKIWPWLSILTPEGRFTFCIGDTPVRFSRNDPKYLPNRKLITSFETQQQMDLFTNESILFAEIRWFIIFDTHFKTPADAVYCVGYTETNEIICKWQIPLEDKVTLISEVNAQLPQPVDIPVAPIKLKRQSQQKNTNSNEI